VKLLMVCSSGGHLRQLFALRPWWSGHQRRWVTFDKPDAVSLLGGERVAWAFHPTTRNVPNAIRNLRLAWKLMRRDRPDVLVSTGAGVAFPFFVVARVFRVPTVYLEVVDRTDTLTGKLCYPLTDLFLLQWDEQRRSYPRGKLVGKVL
jgi:UDP-N-acetylglucosamine:LPS N-acetylglucosamine transferase